MENNVKNILLEALKGVNYNQIILFGSRARKTEKQDSDYDILVIVDDDMSIEETRKIECNIRKKMASYYIDVDILVRTKNTINKYKNISGTVINEALKEGVLV